MFGLGILWRMGRLASGGHVSGRSWFFMAERMARRQARYGSRSRGSGEAGPQTFYSYQGKTLSAQRAEYKRRGGR